MFEGAFISLLAADTELAALLSSFGSAPAIFSNKAPEEAEEMYIVVRIDQFSTENPAVSGFDIYVDIYDRGPSLVNLREAAERVEFITDRHVITGDTRFDSIRLFYDSGHEVLEKDINAQRYTCKLEARAGRKKWMNEVISR